MTYLQLSACFLAATVAVALALGLMARGRGPRPAAVALTISVLLALTAVFDTVMIGSGLFHYADQHLVGIRIGLAPIEDFAYPLCAAFLVPAVFVLLSHPRRAAQEVRP